VVFSLDDRTAIVTGGAAGVGRSLASALARAGAVVTICDTRPGVVQAATELSRGEIVNIPTDHVHRP
jgi:NAD(P)-dependent dehydrogenase (short-subunit alcohol dehydrogenase family)